MCVHGAFMRDNEQRKGWAASAWINGEKTTSESKGLFSVGTAEL